MLSELDDLWSKCRKDPNRAISFRTAHDGVCRRTLDGIWSELARFRILSRASPASGSAVGPAGLTAQAEAAEAAATRAAAAAAAATLVKLRMETRAVSPCRAGPGPALGQGGPGPWPGPAAAAVADPFLAKYWWSSVGGHHFLTSGGWMQERDQGLVTREHVEFLQVRTHPLWSRGAYVCTLSGHAVHSYVLFLVTRCLRTCPLWSRGLAMCELVDVSEVLAYFPPFPSPSLPLTHPHTLTRSRSHALTHTHEESLLPSRLRPLSHAHVHARTRRGHLFPSKVAPSDAPAHVKPTAAHVWARRQGSGQ